MTVVYHVTVEHLGPDNKKRKIQDEMHRHQENRPTAYLLVHTGHDAEHLDLTTTERNTARTAKSPVKPAMNMPRRPTRRRTHDTTGEVVLILWWCVWGGVVVVGGWVGVCVG